MALKIFAMGPTAIPLQSGWVGPIDMNAAAAVSNAPLAGRGMARNPNSNFQPVVSLPAHLPNMSVPFNPRPILSRK